MRLCRRERITITLFSQPLSWESVRNARRTAAPTWDLFLTRRRVEGAVTGAKEAPPRDQRQKTTPLAGVP
jgi:hypothetical protein